MDNDPTQPTPPAPGAVPPPLNPATPPANRSGFPPHRPPPPVAPRPHSGTGWKIAAVLFALMLLLSLMGNFLAVVFSGSSAPVAHGSPSFMEVVLEDNGSRNKIAVFNLDGMISGQPFDPSGYNLVDYLQDQFESCRHDDRIKAVILKVDSPGGEVLASDDIARLIESFQQDSGKPVIASMGSMAASGGYYVSAPCRWIVANELTLTGSIGVIMSGFNWRGLMDKAGVQPMVFKSGKMKDMLSPYKRPDEVTVEEKQIIQGIITASYDRFLTVVGEGREAAAKANQGAGRKLAEDWKDYADGRVLTGKDAHEIGMVDELGNFDTAVDRAQELAGILNANLVTYQQPFKWGSILRLLGESETKTVKIDIGLDYPRLQAGRLYFLPSFLLE